MTRYILALSIVCAMVFTWLPAQTVYEVSQGQGYANQIFFELSTGETTSVSLEDWDIAFGVGPFASGIVVNEGIASGGGPSEDGLVEAYGSTSTDFATADETMIGEQLYNDESSWDFGAFNTVANPQNPLDLGWGIYNPATQTVNGDRVFFVKNRAGVYYKFQFQSLASGVYTFRYAKTDGSNETTVTINKADFVGKTMAYFSFEDGVVDLEPASWDLVFTRYATPLQAGPSVVQYVLTGALHNAGVGVAEVFGEEVNPATEPVPENIDDYDTALDVIGYNWKTLASTNPVTYEIPDDLVYFVRDAEERVWRLQFIDFDASLGINTFSIVDEGLLSAITELPSFAAEAVLFPNPAVGTANLSLNLRSAATGQLDLVNSLGQTVANSRRTVDLLAGENQISIDLNGVPAGNYFVRLNAGNETLVRHLIVR